MKISFFLFLVAVTNAFAGLTYSQNTMFTLHLENTTLRQVFDEIQRQSEFIIFYKDSQVNIEQKISIDVEGSSVEKILDQAFKGSNLTYSISDRQIVIRQGPDNQATTSPPAVESQQGEHKVTGHVTGSGGEPIPGATVFAKGSTNNGTITDAYGNYSITVSAKTTTLQFSFIGMKSREISIDGRSVINVLLEDETQDVEEVVVVGYGQQKKETVTGSISTVKMADLRTPVPTLTNALAGKVAGVISMQSSGEPGYDNSNFTIRGIGTFTGNTSPLIIVDGVQRDDYGSTYSGAYNNIDPEDIQSISLLKDASATAVYGAKGANGVLIITTKKGVRGKPNIRVKAESGISGFTKTPELLDGITWMKLYNEARTNNKQTVTYSDERIQKTASGLDPYLYPNVDWIKEVYHKWSQVYNANINISGGAEAVRYYVSMSFYNQRGNYKVKKLNKYDPQLDYKRYDFRSNVDINVTRSTELSINLAAMLVNSRYPGTAAGTIWYTAYATSPISTPVKYPDRLAANLDEANPFNSVQYAGYTDEFKPSMQSVLTLQQSLDFLTKGLSATGRFSFDSYGENFNYRTANNNLWIANSRDSNGDLVYTQLNYGSDALGYSTESSAERTMYFEANIGYNNTFGDHSLGGLLLYNMRNRIHSSAESVIGSIPYRNQGLAGRITYGYKDKYLIEVNAGYTGSENFAEGNRFGFFPSVSAGWVISNEKFFLPLLRNVNLLKLRASYGQVGNDEIGQSDRFPYFTQISTSSTGASFGYSPQYYDGTSESILGVEDLTWETSTKTNIGIEIGLFNNLNITIEAYEDRRKDILIARSSIAPLAGYSDLTIYANMGEMKNRGLDGSIEYDGNINKDVSLRLFGNFTYSKNKIVFQDEPVRQNAYQSGTGKRYGEITTYVADGLFKDQNDIDDSPVHTFRSVMYPGDIKYKDLNGDEIINESDWKYSGKSSFPTLSYGIGFAVGYKRFDLSMLFQGVWDVGIMANGGSVTGYGSAGMGIVPFAGMGSVPGNILSNVTNRWTEENPSQDVDYPRLSITNTSDNNYLGSTWWLKDGSYCRLKQASVGYTLFSQANKKAWISNMYLYLSGQNLLTFSKFKLWDPELGANAAKYPLLRTVTFGIRAHF